MKGYKIVGRLGWSVVQDTPGFKVKYKVGEYVSRPKKGGPLAVFKDKADAVAFDDYFHELYECVCVHPLERQEGRIVGRGR